MDINNMGNLLKETRLSSDSDEALALEFSTSIAKTFTSFGISGIVFRRSVEMLMLSTNAEYRLRRMAEVSKVKAFANMKIH